MKERGIIFTAESVRAILAGTKSQTRRIVQPMPGEQREWLTPDLIAACPRMSLVGVPGVGFGAQMDHPGGGPLGWVKCPYGGPGSSLWVRETFATMCHVADPCCSCDDEDKARNHYVEYRADLAPGCTDRPGGWPRSPVDDEAPRWKGPRFMPRAASRIALELTDVRVERVQDISEADAKAEGVDDRLGYGLHPYRDAYAKLWDQINDSDGKRWSDSPWVWVLEFRRVQR